VQGHSRRLTGQADRHHIEEKFVKRALVAAALLAVLAGCDTPAPAPAGHAPPTTGQAGPAAVDWAGNLCAAILDFDSTAPRFEVQSSTPAAMISSLMNYLNAMSSRVDSAMSKLQTLGPSPVAGGDEAASGISSSLQRLREIVDRSKTRLSGTDPNDRTAISAALQDIARDLQNLREPVNPLEGMGDRYPDLQAAARSADNCTEISRTRASRTALPPTSSSGSGLGSGSSDSTTPTTSSSTTETTTTTTTEPPTF
jgi:hypothetical protein